MTEAPDSALRYEPIAVTDESTVVAAYTPDPATSHGYQSEAQLEEDFIQRLQAQAYERLVITSSADLVANVRTQLETLNAVTFSDAEWERFFTEKVASKNEGIVEKTAKIQEDPIQVLTARRRHQQEHQADRQVQHPQQPAPGHQPVRDDW